MYNKAFSTSIIACIIILVDFYVLSGLKGAAVKWKPKNFKIFKVVYWIISLTLLVALILAVYFKIPVGMRAGIFLGFFLIAIGKICFLPFVFIDDIRRLGLWLVLLLKKPKPAVIQKAKGTPIKRSEFLMKAGLIAGTIPVASLCYGSFSGAYDYRIVRQALYLPNLPKAFDGMRLGQISDIHTGSFYDKAAVQTGIDMLMNEKPDLIFFTGDLVNDMTGEAYPYMDMFGKIKAPLGVFSCTGNHDYGDYSWWPNEAAKRRNFEDLKKVHQIMGWDLILNDNRRLKVGGEEIGILGVENWGALSRFPKYGKMDLTVKNTDDLPVKLLLSHDPSHWRAQILPHYPQIDVMFSGHTHGMQFGVRTKKFQWSPIEYVYKEWAGLYHEGAQQLYVNVGYGFLGYSGRIGILPEITIFELKASKDPLLRA